MKLETGTMVEVDAGKLFELSERSRKVSGNLSLLVCGLLCGSDQETVDGFSLLLDQMRELASNASALMEGGTVAADQGGCGRYVRGILSEDAERGRARIATAEQADMLSSELQKLHQIAGDGEQGLFDALSLAYYAGIARGSKLAS